MRLIIAILLMATGLAAQQKPADKDNWQRSKECAARVEKLKKDRSIPEHVIRNHYSPKYERCYVLWTEVYSDSNASSSTNGMIDVFEESFIQAQETWMHVLNNELIKLIGRDTHHCMIGTKDVECSEAKRFMDDHMNN